MGKKKRNKNPESLQHIIPNIKHAIKLIKHMKERQKHSMGKKWSIESNPDMTQMWWLVDTDITSMFKDLRESMLIMTIEKLNRIKGKF